MKVADILTTKGAVVKTIRPNDTILALAQRLAAEKVGAMVVVSFGDHIDGIVTERDIANGLAAHAHALPDLKVSDLMTRKVVTCTVEDTVADIAKIMSNRCFRHMPVVDGEKLVGLISIGDVLAHRLDALQAQSRMLRDALIGKT